MNAASMALTRPSIDRQASDAELYSNLLELDDKDIVELGCGSAVHTRAIATAGAGRRITAFEVDRIQHDKNLAIVDLPNVSFRYGGAEAIELPDAGTDIVFLFKSLHHVPAGMLDRALGEIHRILRPGGTVYVSEPIFAGAFNDIIRLFHDEQSVREAAFNALQRAVAQGLFELVRQEFFLAPTRFESFGDFETRIIRATHSEHRLDAATYERVRSSFNAYLADSGPVFETPMRVDLLRKSG